MIISFWVLNMRHLKGFPGSWCSVLAKNQAPLRHLNLSTQKFRHLVSQVTFENLGLGTFAMYTYSLNDCALKGTCAIACTLFVHGSWTRTISVRPFVAGPHICDLAFSKAFDKHERHF